MQDLVKVLLSTRRKPAAKSQKLQEQQDQHTSELEGGGGGGGGCCGGGGSGSSSGSGEKQDIGDYDMNLTQSDKVFCDDDGMRSSSSSYGAQTRGSLLLRSVCSLQL
jgi:hypothetical protein